MLDVAWNRNPWSIFDELEALQADLNRAFTGGGAYRPARRGQVFPRMNVWSSKEGLIIDAELPGVDVKDVDISVKGDELTLQGKTSPCETGKDVVWRRQERPSGEFSRMLQLPFKADGNGVKAAYKNGILRISVPRSEEEKPKQIAIEAA